MNLDTARSRARMTLTDPVACLAKIASAGRLADRIGEACRLSAIAREPDFRFGLVASDTAVVVPAIDGAIVALLDEARPIARKVLAMRKRGVASDEIGHALDLLPGEASALVSFCQ